MRFPKKIHNPKQLWNYIKSVIPSKRLIPAPNKLDINYISVEDSILISKFLIIILLRLDKQSQKVRILQTTQNSKLS